jgi:hypothetical protein
MNMFKQEPHYSLLRVELSLNGESVVAWDPFCIVETKEPVAEKKMDVRLQDGTQTSFVVRAFVLPRKEEFSSDANRLAARISNERSTILWTMHFRWTSRNPVSS